jgi:hypothetical protein
MDERVGVFLRSEEAVVEKGGVNASKSEGVDKGSVPS